MDRWQATFIGLKQLPRELPAFEIEAFFTFTPARASADPGRATALLRARAGQIIALLSWFWGLLGHKNRCLSWLSGRTGEVNARYREELKEMISGGRQPARRFKRAQILLASDAGRSEKAITQILGMGSLNGVPNATPLKVAH